MCHTHACICTHIHTQCVRAYRCVCTCRHHGRIQTGLQIDKYVNIHTHICICIERERGGETYKDTHTHAHLYTHIYIYVYTCIYIPTTSACTGYLDLMWAPAGKSSGQSWFHGRCPSIGAPRSCPGPGSVLCAIVNMLDSRAIFNDGHRVP